MRALLRTRRRRDLLAAFQRIAAEEQLGSGIQTAALEQLAEAVKLLQPERLSRDSTRLAEWNRNRLRAKLERERRERVEKAAAEQEAVQQRLEENAAYILANRSRGCYAPAVGLALATALGQNGSQLSAA